MPMNELDRFSLIRGACTRHPVSYPPNVTVPYPYRIYRIRASKEATCRRFALRPLTHDALDHHGSDAREHGLGYRG